MVEFGPATVSVSRETRQKLNIYAALLQRWQAKINLVSATTLDTVWDRHFLDSLQLRLIAPTARRWIDLGSGAGFPGLIVAIDLGMEPEAKVHLVESNGKKCAFLREVIRETAAPAIVHQGRIEAVLPELAASLKPEIISARALAPLTALIGMTHQMLTTSTRALFLKGQDVEVELTESSKCWSLDYRLHQSVDPRGRIVELTRATALDRTSRI